MKNIMIFFNDLMMVNCFTCKIINIMFKIISINYLTIYMIKLFYFGYITLFSNSHLS